MDRMELTTALDYEQKGVACFEQGSLKQAARFFRLAIAVEPNYFRAHHNLGVVLQEQGKLGAAIKQYQKSVECNPRYAIGWKNLGSLHLEMGDIPRATKCFEKVVEIKPDLEDVVSQLFFIYQNCCDWAKLDQLTPLLDRLTAQALSQGKVPPETPFINISRCDDPARNLVIAERWSAHIADSMRSHQTPFTHVRTPLAHIGRRGKKKKVVLGYLSNNFNDHPIGHLVASLFGLHDRDTFAVNGYSYGPDDQSYYRKKIVQSIDTFVDLTQLDNTMRAAERIHADEVDILIDLVGFTKHARLGICALRPAPLQISYLGFPGSSGADFFDYLITDPVVTAPDQQQFMSEKCIFLPDCYQINDYQSPHSTKQCRRSEFGLPENCFVFTSFVQPYKIEPVLFHVWMNVLKRVSQSVLWLWGHNQQAMNNLRLLAKAEGIIPERLVFSPKAPKEDHFNRLKLADLALDTRIYGGHVTTSDALWAGVPVISLLGRHFASRVSSSILHAAGLSELVTHSLTEYQDLAIALAHHPQKVIALKTKLKQGRTKNPLFNTPRAVKYLEKAYAQVWEKYLSGETAQPVVIGLS